MVGNKPVSFYDWQGTIKVPVDIFITDIVNPMAKSIGTGWFEELVWNEQQKHFRKHRTRLWPRNGRIEGESAEWFHSSVSRAAIAIFREEHKKLRLFVTITFSIWASARMGLPEFAGILKR